MEVTRSRKKVTASTGRGTRFMSSKTLDTAHRPQDTKNTSQDKGHRSQGKRQKTEYMLQITCTRHKTKVGQSWSQNIGHRFKAKGHLPF